MEYNSSTVLLGKKPVSRTIMPTLVSPGLSMLSKQFIRNGKPLFLVPTFGQWLLIELSSFLVDQIFHSDGGELI